MEKQQASSEDVYIRDKIQNIFVTYIIPLNILHIFGKYSEHILVQQDYDLVMAAVAKGGSSLGATELLHRLYRYKGWYQCLLSVLRDPDVKMSHVAQMMEDALAPRENLKFNNFSCQKRQFNLLLIGKTGSGKSATGNSILQEKKFTTSNLTASGTQEVQVAEGDIDGYKVTIVECPGVGDSSLDNLKDTEKLCGNMEKAMTLCGDGFHVLLLVLNYGNKYTRDEQESIQKFKAIFGENIVRDFCIIIMTHGENFDMDVADSDSPITFRDWLSQQTGAFQDLLQECGKRCILFQNKTTNTEYKENQKKNLFSLVQDIMCKDIRYTPEHFALAERQRIKLLVESKKPYLEKKISERTSKLSDELDHLQVTNLSGKIQALLSLKKEAEELLSEIDEEDKGTRTFNNLRKNVINFHKLVEKEIEEQINALERLQPDGTACKNEQWSSGNEATKKFNNVSCQKREFNFLLIGKTGSGKSATGNSILQEKKFTTSSLTTSGTQEVQAAEGNIGDYKVTIVDCPGVGDSSLDNLKDTEKLCKNMEEAMNLCGAGFHALLLVLKYGNKYTHDEQEAIQKFKAIFGENTVRDFCIIIMTHGENFDMDVADSDSPITFRDWLSRQTGAFQDLLQECGKRCILFQNKTANTEYKENQTKNFLFLVQDMMFKDIRYTHEHFARAERQRIKLLVESKKPYLEKNISERTSKLYDEFNCPQVTSLSGKIQALQSLKKETEEILSEIDEEDQGTRALDNLRKIVINFHKLVEKKTEKQIHAVERLQPDGTVSISEAHGAFQLSINSISVERFDSDIKCSAWNPVGDLLAVGCVDAAARIWNMGEHTDGLENLLTLDHKDRGSTTTSHITSLDWARDGTYLATGCSEGITRLWTKDGNLITTFGQNEGSIYSVKWSRGGTYILTTAKTDSWVATVYDAENGSCVQNFLLDSGRWIGCFVDWQNDNTFASRVNKRSIKIYSTGAQMPVKSLEGHTLIINDIKWDPQGQLLASCSDDETVKIWDMKKDQPIHNLLGHTNFVLKIKWSPTGPGTDNPNQNLILASASQDETVRLWDVQYGTCLPQLAKKHTTSVMKVSFSPDGKYIASGDADDFVCIWDVKTGLLAHSYRINEPKGKPSILDMYWTHRGDKLVAPTRNGPVNVCDLRMVMPHRQLDS